MKAKSPSHAMARREFITAGAGLSAAMALGSLPGALAAPATQSPSRRKSIGIQVGAVSFVDEGTEQVLDLFQERGAIDTIYLTTFTYGRGLAGRQVPGQPFPDHGKQESDEKTFHWRPIAMGKRG